MRIIARIHPGPAWLAGKTVFEQGPVMNEHLAFMRERFDDGTLLVGGPLATEESGLALFEAADLTTASDPRRPRPGRPGRRARLRAAPAPAVLRRAQRRPRGRSRKGPGPAHPEPAVTFPRRGTVQ